MGPKITVDSSTLMNKGLEVIEAHELFGVPYDAIDVLVHPQSIVHSIVEFADGASMAQLSQPDMRLPIGYALAYPDRLPVAFGPIDWARLSSLDFEPPDRDPLPLPRHRLPGRPGRRPGPGVAQRRQRGGGGGLSGRPDRVDGHRRGGGGRPRRYQPPPRSGSERNGAPWRNVEDVLEADGAARRSAEAVIGRREVLA